jgi:hypothetical protein
MALGGPGDDVRQRLRIIIEFGVGLFGTLTLTEAAFGIPKTADDAPNRFDPFDIR